MLDMGVLRAGILVTGAVAVAATGRRGWSGDGRMIVVITLKFRDILVRDIFKI